ncbi:hypothetical protein [Hymenobacter metallicola]|uniref:Outer membrane protein beta-barrel domain-containing protein n=1 Tax=Hymenobacter metallicola TaxID=2563114 RepID=A0A4Z0QHH2_9BACT|nr:hypothetical protein [Hymenobacter metallicola]TGE28703.1 hypothetical protein E5K02_04345 [Hymenobacter metallicola]
MKRIFFLLALGSSSLWLAPAARAQTDTTRTRPAQKPQLNTAPPGAAPARPTQPAERPAVPVPAPPPLDAPLPKQTDPNSPSGLEFPAGSRASEQPKPLRRYFLYSNFGLGYSSNPYSGGQFSASISPAVGYRVTDKLAVGPGISYAYNNISFPSDYQQFGLPRSLNLNSVGVKAFLQYIVYKEFFIHAEYEVTKAQSYYIEELSANPLQLRAVTVNRSMRTPLAGVGYRNQLGDRFAADIVVLYNFNDGYDIQGYPLSPYGQPVIRFSFLFDLK